MTKPKTVIAMLLSLVLVFALTACGSKAETEPEAEPQTETGRETTEDSDDYDIASNLQLLSSRSESENGYNNGGYGQSNGSMGTAYANSSDMGPGGNYDIDPDGEDIPF